MARKPALKTRIEQLYKSGTIDLELYDHMREKNKYVQEALPILREELGVHFYDFESRAIEIVRCRGKGHKWNEVSPLGYKRPSGAAFIEVFICSRCGVVRIRALSAFKRPRFNKYYYPEDYSMPGVRTSPSDWEVLVFRASLEEDLAKLEAGIMPEQCGDVIEITTARKRTSKTA